MIHVNTKAGEPKRHTGHHTKKELDAILYGFMRQETKFGRVECWATSYASMRSAQCCLINAAHSRNLDISVIKVGNELWFRRNDM